jgi:hypothetical protein
VLGKVQRRHPYNLGKHSNSNKNFEIQNFANINIPGNSGMLQSVQDGYLVVQPTYVMANAGHYPLPISIYG